jgi:3-dehydroquinate dehydratase/shikimate dehydrogenase
MYLEYQMILRLRITTSPLPLHLPIDLHCTAYHLPLQGKSFLVVGAGGAGRALAFGAASRGAKVLIANRNKARAEALAAAVPGGATVVDWEELQSGAVSADVLANSTSVGMVPNVEETPVATAAVGNVSCG